MSGAVTEAMLGMMGGLVTWVSATRGRGRGEGRGGGRLGRGRYGGRGSLIGV